MARHLRIEYPGAIYHARVRGNARGVLFTEDRERERFLVRLAESVETYNVRLYAYCLMTNHVHLAVETPNGNLGRFMQSLLTGYSVYFNLRHGRHGHLTEGRYKPKLVEGDNYLLNLGRYIHRNPVFTKKTEKLPIKEKIRILRQYRWSSYRGYIDKSKREDYVDYGPMLGQMSGKQSQWRRRYRGFVENGLDEADEEFIEAMNESPRAIGSTEFLAWVDKQYHKLIEKQEKLEDVAFRRMQGTIDTETVLGAVAEAFKVDRETILRRQRNTDVRGVAAQLLCQYGGLTQRQVADLLGLKTGAAVSYQIRKVKTARARDKRLAKKFKKLQKELDPQRPTYQ